MSRASERPSWLAAPRATPARVAAWLAAVALHRAGLLALVAQRRARRGRPLILVFHRVVAPSEPLVSQPGIVVTAATFERIVRVLAGERMVRVTTLEKAAAPAAGALAARESRLPVAVTFDDAWSETESVALPVLLKHGVPATLFVPAGFVGTSRLFWPERAIQSFATPDARTRTKQALRHLGMSLNADAEAFIARLKETDEQEREALLAAIGAPRAADPPPVLSWDAVRRLVAAGIEIGSHGMEHRILTRISEGDAEADLRAASARIAEETGKAPAAVAYPNGDASAAVAASARRVGHRLGFVVRGAARGAGDPMRIPRRNIHEATGAGPFGFSESLLLAETLGVFDDLRPDGDPWRARLASVAALAALLLALFAPVVRTLARIWTTSAPDAHGLLVPPVALYLAWGRRAALFAALPSGSWKGTGLLAAGLLLGALSAAGSSQTGQFAALVASIWGIVWARLGDRAAKLLAIPMLALLLAIPVPFGVEISVSLPLRHAASLIGVAMARGLGAPAILEGNVIHLAEASLNVDEACSGLRSLVSLVVIGTLYMGAAQVSAARAALLFAALPVLAVLANALRLFVTVLAVRTGGASLAEGSFHTALGFATFALALGGMLVLERILRWRDAPRTPASS